MQKVKVAFLAAVMIFGVTTTAFLPTPVEASPILRPKVLGDADSLEARQTAEAQILLRYVSELPKIPRSTVKTKKDLEEFAQAIMNMPDSKTIQEMYPYLSSKSIEMLVQTPLIVAEINSSLLNPNSTLVSGSESLKIFKGKQYGVFKYKMKDKKTKKRTTIQLFFIKEYGQWKIDFLQTLKYGL